MYATHFVWLSVLHPPAKILVNLANVIDIDRDDERGTTALSCVSGACIYVTETLDEIALALGIGPRPAVCTCGPAVAGNLAHEPTCPANAF